VSPRAGSSAAAARRAAKGRAALIAAYREGLGLAAIVVIQKGAETRIAVIREGGASAGSGPDTVMARWWCRYATDAERVAAAATARSRRRESQDELPRSPPSVSAAAADDVSAAVQGVAKRLRVALYSDDEICMNADTIIVRVEEEIENLKRGGQLKSVNQSYRAYRLEASARGEKAAPYAEWFNKYKANLVRELAAALRHA
jgi:hypothetical protein